MSLFKKYGESLLDQPIGIEESQVRQAKDSESHGIFQNNKRYERVARRAYRQSMRDKDFGGAMKALDWIDGKTDGNGLGSGIQQAGVAMDMAQHQAGGFMDQNRPTPPAQGDLTSQFPQQSENLRQRIGLFGEMTDTAAAGGDLLGFQERASQLGVDNKSFKYGSGRAQEAAKMRDAANRPSLDSPAFSGRLAAFGGAKSSLFDRYTSAYA